jgi:hypothetical protein
LCRRRVLALVVGAVGLSVVLIAGVVLSAVHLVHAPTTPADARPSRPSVSTAGPAPVSGQVAKARDALAARAMPDTGTGMSNGRPDLSTRDPGAPIVLPPGRSVGAWGVQTGFPQTPEGAMAQLAAIDVAALGSASLAGVRAVIRDWAAPGGPTPRSWSGVKAMASLLESIGVTADGTARLNVRAIAQMGLIKGTVGDDFVVACVDFTIDISFGGTSRTAAADCQRMLWLDGRWVIGPGAEPAQAPQAWPGTDAALDAGYRDLLAA